MSEEKRSDGIFSFYSDTLHTILSYLRYEQLCQLQRLSKDTQNDFVTVASRCKYLCISLDRKGLIKSAAKHCRHIVDIEVTKTQYVGAKDGDIDEMNQCIAQILLNNPKISALTLAYAKDDGLFNCLETMKDPLPLEKFARKGLLLRDLSRFLAIHGKKIRILSADAQVIVEWGKLSEFCPNLEDLKFVLRTVSPYLSFPSILHQFPNLKKVDVMFVFPPKNLAPLRHFGLISLRIYLDSHYLPKTWLLQLVSCLPNLICLSVDSRFGVRHSARFPGFSVRGLEKSCPKLTELSLGGTDESVGHLLPHFSTSLEKLVVGNFHYPGKFPWCDILKVYRQIGIVFKKLKTLSIYFRDLNIDSCEAITAIAPNLESLNIGGNKIRVSGL